MGNYHARCGAAEKPEVVTPEAYYDKIWETLVGNCVRPEVASAL